MLHEMGIDTGVDLLKAMDTARLAASVVGHEAGSAVLKAGRVPGSREGKTQGSGQHVVESEAVRGAAVSAGRAQP